MLNLSTGLCFVGLRYMPLGEFTAVTFIAPMLSMVLAGWLLKEELERRGQVILTGADTAEIVGTDGHVSGVRLKDGREIPADIVVMAVGIRPNVKLAQDAGLHCDRGIVVSEDRKSVV